MQFTKQELKEFKRWMAALRSGTYKQTKSYFQTSQGHCCLGVACEVLIAPEKQVRQPGQVNNLVGGTFQGEYNKQPHAPKWLTEIEDDFYAKVTQSYTENGEALSITCMNDLENMSFDEIADMLELVYLHKALG